MTLVWLIVWLVYGTPDLHQWNGWLIALIACFLVDVGGGSSQ